MVELGPKILEAPPASPLPGGLVESGHNMTVHGESRPKLFLSHGFVDAPAFFALRF